jgi:hypothetical protein
MRKTIIIASALAASLTLAACSEKTQDAAEQTADSAGQDVAGAANAVGEVAETGAAAVGDAAREGAAAVGEAADKAAAATDELGAKVEDGRAKAEADLHNESVSEAKRD